MSLRDAYREKLEARLDEQQARLDLLKAQARKAVADGKIMAYEEIGAVESKLDHLRSKVKQLAASGEGAWEEIKHGIEKAWEDLNEARKKAAAKLTGPE